ncbi:peptidoglycan DD-metalloendopeptidase family protein [bacterium LRH843]|nr:peptidoglycan DD-metalloendopeptidase family protein [bacterium LRH843]
MRQEFKFIVLALLLVTSSLGWDSFHLTAQANSEIKNKITEVQRERDQKQDEAKKTEEEIKKVAEEIKSINEEIQKIDHEVATTSQNIRTKRVEIEEVRAHIETLRAEIVELEERIAERDSLLKERARTMYQTGGGSINYLEVILGAKSFGDFLDRVSALSVIAQQDRNIIEAHIADQVQLEETKAEVEGKLQALENHLAELETLMADLEAKRAQKDDLMNRLEEKEGTLNDDLVSLEQADEILRSQESALKKELAEYERREAARRAQSVSRSGSQTLHSTPAVTGAGFMRPATGSVTSTFGPRASFGGKMHYGIDIGKNGRSGDVPIVSVQDGTVVSARYMNGYGNTVIIAHYVDGKLITTLYGHLESYNVSSGERVSKGQSIGTMGNTGASYGAHLHFEVHEGGWNGAKSNAVNPLSYIPN